MANNVKKRKLQKHFVERLSKLAEHLEFGKLAHPKFNFAVFNGKVADEDELTGVNPELPGCGTAGCALGECPAIFKQWEFRDTGSSYIRTKYFPVLKSVDSIGNIAPVDLSARKFFGLKELEARHLFYPDRQLVYTYGGKDLDNNATREHVAANIRAFLYKLKTQPWGTEEE